MAWVTIKGRRYYRRSRRVNGRVVTEHIGGGEFGELLAELDHSDRVIRRSEAELAKLDDELDRENLATAVSAGQFLDDLFTVAAYQSGYYRHRRQWRRTRRADPMSAELQKQLKKLAAQLDQAQARKPLMAPDLSGIPEADRATLQAAAKGDKAALVKAQPYLSDPKYIRAWGNPMYATRCWLVSQVSGDDVIVARATHSRIAMLQKDLGHESANMLEKIAITRIVHNWLAVAALDARACQTAAGSRERANVEKSLTQAERRLMQAVKTLAFLRDFSVAALMARVNAATAEEPKALNGYITSSGRCECRDRIASVPIVESHADGRDIWQLPYFPLPRWEGKKWRADILEGWEVHRFCQPYGPLAFLSDEEFGRLVLVVTDGGAQYSPEAVVDELSDAIRVWMQQHVNRFQLLLPLPALPPRNLSPVERLQELQRVISYWLIEYRRLAPQLYAELNPAPAAICPRCPVRDSNARVLVAGEWRKTARGNGTTVIAILDAFESAGWPDSAVAMGSISTAQDRNKCIERFLKDAPIDIRPDGTGNGMVGNWKLPS